MFSPKKKLVPTSEQQKIIQTAKEGKNLSIQAFAGAAKTSTCIMIAEAIYKPSIYVAFNKSIADEATTKFPPHVTCKTLHSIAWRAIIKNSKSKFGRKLKGFFDNSDVDMYKPSFYKEEIWFEKKQQVIDVIKNFCQSAEKDLKAFSEWFIALNNWDNALNDIVLSYWEDIINENTDTTITHDVYLKLFHLKSPKLEAEIVYLDEAQDSNPVTLDIVLKQQKFGTQIIIVGDPYQSIYEWRGAINAFENIPEDFIILYLTESFRFNYSIAEKASKLTYIAGNTIPVIGLAKNEESPILSTAILVRNNSTLLDYLLAAANRNEKIFCLTDLSDLWSKLYHIQALYFKDFPKYPNRELNQYKTFKELEEASKHSQELERLLKISKKLSFDGLTANIAKIKACLTETPKDSNFTLSTIHKSKGLEWDEVIIADDVIYLTEEQSIIDVLFENQTLNLLYVAVTRAKKIVHCPNLVNEILGNWEIYKEENYV